MSTVEKEQVAHSPYEIQIDGICGLNTKIGFNSKILPQIAYISVKGKLKPNERKTVYTEDVSSIKKQFRSLVKKEVSENGYFTDKFIFNLEIGEKYINTYEKSFIRYDVYVKPKNPLKGILCHKKEVTELSERMNKGLLGIIKDNNFFIP